MPNGTITGIQERDLESVWEDGEQEFSDWLAANIELLGAELGLELTDARAEAAEGDGPADVVASEATTDNTVVVENEFDTTSSDHLGELMTAASEHDAGLVVWVAETFTHEHRGVLEWLNESGPEHLNCFAITPRVVSIPDSETHGVEFGTLAEPDDWGWDVSDDPESERETADEANDETGADEVDDETEADEIETGSEYGEFFGKMAEAYTDRRPGLDGLNPNNESSMAFGTSVSGVEFEWVFHGDSEFSVELYIATPDAERNEMIFKSLRETGDEIESELGVGLEWQPLPEHDACRINWPRHIEGAVSELDEDQQAQLVEWGAEAMDEFQSAIEPRLLSIDIEA
jgi:hypothetical protein